MFKHAASKFVEQCRGQVMMSFTYTTITTGGIATDTITWRSKWKQVWCAMKLIISPLIDIYMLPLTDYYLAIYIASQIPEVLRIAIVRWARGLQKNTYLQSVANPHIQISYVTIISLSEQTKVTLHCGIDNVWGENVLPYS